MELIKEIFEKDIITDTTAHVDKYRLRKAARAVLFKENKIAMLYVAKNTYHKLPGGGIDEGEDIEEGLHREILEETGCTVTIKDKVGITIEYKDTVRVLQISYIYSAEVIKESLDFNFTEKEKSQGFVLEWYSLHELQDIFSKDDPKDYDGKFISVRDQAIMKYFQRLKNS